MESSIGDYDAAALLASRQTQQLPPPGGNSSLGAPPGGGGGPPPGLPPLPDYYRYPPFLNQHAPLLGFTISLMVISWICSLSRLYIRFFVKRAPGWDDFFIFLTMLTTTMGSVVLCLMTRMKLGRPIFELTVPERMAILKRIYVTTLSYPLSATFIKLALLLQYMATFERSRGIRTVCQITIVASAVQGLAFAAMQIFSCWPVSAFWESGAIPVGKCWGFASRQSDEFMVAMVTQVVSTAVLDMLVFVIPGYVYLKGEEWSSRKGRWSLVGLLGLGSAAMICSLWRVVYVIQLKDKSPFDPVWNTATIMGLASYELHLAAICAALPIMWPVLKTTWDRIFVTYEVTVTEDYGAVFPSRKEATDLELQSVPTSINEQRTDRWEPFLGDETTGLGENATVVVAEKRTKKMKEMFRRSLSRGPRPERLPG